MKQVQKYLFLIYGVFSYFLFFGTVLYLMGFFIGVLVIGFILYRRANRSSGSTY